MQIVHYSPNLLDDIARFIARLNADAAHTIGYFGVDVDGIARTIQEFTPPPEQGAFVAYDGDQLVGFLGINLDAGLGRMWIHGPLVQHEAWHTIADMLYWAMQPVVPHRIHEYELFCSIDNTNCQQFARRHHFKLHGGAAIYVYPRDKLDRIEDASVPEIEPAYYDQLARLQDQLFPRSYFSGSQLARMIDDHTRVFATTDNGALTGYVFCRVKPELGDGYVDFVGVIEAARRRGIARRLLGRAIHWMLSFQTVDAVKLTVMTRNEAACQLYESVGFDLRQRMIAYRKHYTT